MKIVPLGDRVVLKEIESTEEKIGSIYVPDIAREAPVYAEVVGIGDETSRVAVGDIVVRAKYSGAEVKIGDEKYIIIDTADVLARVE